MKARHLLFVPLLALLLGGCNINIPSSSSSGTSSQVAATYKVSYETSSDYTVTGLKESYAAGEKVSFSITVNNATKQIKEVKVGVAELSPVDGVYSFTMPKSNIDLTITLKDKPTGDEFRFEQIDYNLKPGVSRSELKGAPWINANMQGQVAKIQKPSLKDDFYTSINYDDLVANNPGMMDLSTDRNMEIFNQMYDSSSGKPNASVFNYARYLMPEGAASDVHEYLTGINISNYLNSSDLFSSEHSFFQIQKDDENKYYVSFTDGYSHGVINLAFLSIAECDNYKSYIISYLNNAFSLGLSVSNINEVNAFDNLTCEKSYETSTWSSYTIDSGSSISFLNNALKDYGLTNLDQIYISSCIPTIVNKYFGDLDIVRNSLICRLAFEYRFLAGFDYYRPMSQYIAATGWFIGEYNLNDYDDSTVSWYTVRLMLPCLAESVYLKIAGSPSTKSTISGVIEEMLAGYKATVATYDWLDTDTKNGVLRKLNNMEYFSCYSDKIRNYPALDETDLYDLNLFQLYRRYQRWVYNLTHDGNLEINHAWYVMPIYTVNAFYSPSTNQFVILNGILSGYPITGSYEEVLGSIGVVIGHEISHSFDENGSQYDEHGHEVDWWTASSKANFTAKVTKMKEFYNQINLFDTTYVNGALVNTEATADMGGVHIALEIAKGKADFNYDLFFRTYAKLWLSRAYSSSQIASRLEDEHPFAYLRVNATLAQFQEFFDTYDIGPGDRMYIKPSERVAIW